MPWLLMVFMLLATTADAKPRGPVAILAPASEPGTRLFVSGRVFDATGTKPVAGVTVYAYQTDATGVYHKPFRREPRLQGWAITDAQGKFELRTIRPGSYPGRRDPAHIHFQAWGAGYPKQWLDDLQFTDDPKVTPDLLAKSRAKGKFAPIVTPTRGADGALHATINMRLKNESNF